MIPVNMEVDLCIDASAEGITTDLYVGEMDNYVASQTTDWETIIDSVYTLHCLPSGDLVYDAFDLPGPHGIDEIMSTVTSMRDAADRLENRVFESKIFLRHKWLEDGTPNIEDDRKKYTVTYSDYCQDRLILEGHI